MSPKKIQGPGPSDGVQRALGLVGRFSMAVDEIAVPVLVTQDLEFGPFMNQTPGARGVRVPAQGAGVNAFLGLRPAAGTIVQLDEVTIVNDDATRAQFSLRMNPHDQWEGFTLGATSTPVDTNDREPPQAAPPGATSATVQIASNAGVAGGTVWLGELGSGETRTVSLPAVMLYGREGNRPVLSIQKQLVNESFIGSLRWREYELRA